MKRRLLLTACACLFLLCLKAQSPSPKYEFRGVWMATVENIDWPSRKTLTTDQQKAEFVRILDLHQANGMNAIVLQVRPSADAFYPSQFEPWSEYLTGRQGTPPNPWYDPLQFAIDECHKRGMELHAWLNPYRAVFSTARSSIAPTHITRLKPDWFITFDGKKYFDPGEPQVLTHVGNVVRDLVRRYDIDAVHMDDYFYPYRVPGKEFPDDKNYRRYPRGLKKDDWRRSNCDSIIRQLSLIIREENPRVKFGISPFGVWRNKSQDPLGSDSKAGQTNYDDLYADILLWLSEGWIDYVTPQLYREIGDKLIAYDKLVPWWANNRFGKHLYIGHGIYRAGSNAAWKNPREIPEEIKLNRANGQVQGSLYFSSKSFEKNPLGWNDSLRRNYYRLPALVPPMFWIDSIAPSAPVWRNYTEANGGLQLELAVTDTVEEVNKTVLYWSTEPQTLGQQPMMILPRKPGASPVIVRVTADQLPAGQPGQTLYVAASSVDRENNESALSLVAQFVWTARGWVVQKR